MRPQEAEPCKTWEFNLIKDIAESQGEDQARPEKTGHKRNVLIVVELSFSKMKMVSYLSSTDTVETADIYEKLGEV